MLPLSVIETSYANWNRNFLKKQNRRNEVEGK